MKSINKFFSGTLLILRWAFIAGSCFLGMGACGKKANPTVPEAITPKSVKNFRAVARSEGIILLWQPASKNTDDTSLLDLGGFKIFREELPFEKSCSKCPKSFLLLYDYAYNGTRAKVPEQKYFVYPDSALTFGNVYTYKMHCYNERGILSPASERLGVFWDTPVAPPARLQGIKRYRTIMLEWESPAALEDGTPTDEIAGFNIYRTLARGLYDLAPINSESIVKTTFQDAAVEYDHTYFYTVRTLREVGSSKIESAPSEEIAVAYWDTTAPGIPQGLTAIPVAAGVLLKWMPKTERDFAGFNVYSKGPNEEDFSRLNAALVTKNSWTDRTAQIGNFYIYGITAVDKSRKANESPLSETAEVLYLLR